MAGWGVAGDEDASKSLKVDAVELNGLWRFLLGPWAPRPWTTVAMCAAGLTFLLRNPLAVPALCIGLGWRRWMQKKPVVRDGELVLSTPWIVPKRIPIDELDAVLGHGSEVWLVHRGVPMQVVVSNAEEGEKLRHALRGKREAYDLRFPGFATDNLGKFGLALLVVGGLLLPVTPGPAQAALFAVALLCIFFSAMRECSGRIAFGADGISVPQITSLRRRFIPYREIRDLGVSRWFEQAPPCINVTLKNGELVLLWGLPMKLRKLVRGLIQEGMHMAQRAEGEAPELVLPAREPDETLEAFQARVLAQVRVPSYRRPATPDRPKLRVQTRNPAASSDSRQAAAVALFEKGDRDALEAALAVNVNPEVQEFIEALLDQLDEADENEAADVAALDESAGATNP